LTHIVSKWLLGCEGEEQTDILQCAIILQSPELWNITVNQRRFTDQKFLISRKKELPMPSFLTVPKRSKKISLTKNNHRLGDHCFYRWNSLKKLLWKISFSATINEHGLPADKRHLLSFELRLTFKNYWQCTILALCTVYKTKSSFKIPFLRYKKFWFFLEIKAQQARANTYKDRWPLTWNNSFHHISRCRCIEVSL